MARTLLPRRQQRHSAMIWTKNCKEEVSMSDSVSGAVHVCVPENKCSTENRCALRIGNPLQRSTAAKEADAASASDTRGHDVSTITDMKATLVRSFRFRQLTLPPSLWDWLRSTLYNESFLALLVPNEARVIFE